MQSFYYEICASSRLYTLTVPFDDTPAARPYINPFGNCTTHELKTFVGSRAWHAAVRESRLGETRESKLAVQEGAFALASLLQLFSKLTTSRGSPSEDILLKVSTSRKPAKMRWAEQVRNYFVSLALYIKKFPTDAIVAFVKKSLSSSAVALDCGP